MAIVAGLVVALPLLLAALTLGTGGLPHEARLEVQCSHDASLAALDKVERFLRGDFDVVLSAPRPALEAIFGPSRPVPGGSAVCRGPGARAGAQAVALDPVERGSLERRF